jgi:hypothetical protein
MAESKKIKDHMNELKVIKHHIKPQDLEVGKEYHVPPFFSIKRMDILITSKVGSLINFKIVSDSTDKTEKGMEESSILSRFIVPKRSY